MGFTIEDHVLTYYLNTLNERDIVIPDGVTAIGEGAFFATDFMQSVTMPDSVTEIRNGAFYDCTDLKCVRFSDHITSIGKRAFCGCRDLTEVQIPAGCKTIGERAFHKCRLTSFTVLSPDCRFESGVIDSGRYRALDEVNDLVTHLSVEDLADFICTNWSRLSAERKAWVFLTHLYTPAFRTRTDFFEKARKDKTFLKDIAVAVPGLLSPASSEDECLAAAALLTDFDVELSQETAIAIAVKLHSCPNGAAAVGKIMNSLKAYAILNDGGQGHSSESPERDRLFQTALEALALTPKKLESQLKKNYGLVPEQLPVLKWKDDSPAGAEVLCLLLTAYDHPDELSALLAEVSHKSLMAVLRSFADDYLVRYAHSKAIRLSYPICRYADEELMLDLWGRFQDWPTSSSGTGAPLPSTFLDAALDSETCSALLLEDQYRRLPQFLQRISYTGLSACCSLYLGMDEQFETVYDLGSFTVKPVIQPDFSVVILSPDSGKVTKTLPKKGADPALYETAAEDLKELRSGVRKMAKIFSDMLLGDFLSGREQPAAGWKSAASVNPIFKALAGRLVWCQGERTFILTENGAETAEGAGYEIDDDTPIRVAHPMELEADVTEAWRTAFLTRLPAQPFEQIWEPAYSPEEITEDRYKGCVIPTSFFAGLKKHGIPYGGCVPIRMDDCTLDATWDLPQSTEELILGRLQIQKFTRRVNHILYLFDKGTTEERIRKDDVSVTDMLRDCTAAQITQYIDLAAKSKAANVAAALQNYKQQHFPEYDAFSEFTLELL